MKLFGSITELVAAVFRKNSQAITVRPNQTTTYTGARDVQLPPQDANSILVSENATQTLSGKSIDADTNTITNIENADIKSGAAIDATKIADGSVSNAEFQALNGVSGSLVDTTSAQTLSNKSLVDANTSIIDDGDATKILKFQVSGISTGTTRTLTVPDASDTVVVLAAAQALTNKTIDADLNTLSNIENADIKSGAAIDAAKLADGSVDNTEFQRLGTAGTAGAGNLVTTDGTQVLTNKDLDGGTASNARRITVPKDTLANLTALTRKQGTIAYATDITTLVADDGSTLVPVGSGSGVGELNAILNPSAATAITGWTGSNGSSTAVRTTTASELPLGPVISSAIKLDFAAPSGSVYYRFTMPDALKNTKLKLQWFQRQLAAHAANSVLVSIHTNTLSNYTGTDTKLALSTDNLSSNSYVIGNDGQYTSYFDADSSDYYELRFERNSTTTSFSIANVIVGPGIQAAGAVITPPVAFTPGWTNMVPSGSNSAATYTRMGEYMLIQVAEDITSGSGGGITMDIPAGLNVNSAHASLQTDAGGQFGKGNWINAGAFDDLSMTLGGVTDTLSFVRSNGSSLLGTNVNAGDNINFSVMVPIAEWAGGGTVNLAENAVEYASNSSSTDADDTTSFAYGPAGSAGIIGVTALTTRRQKYVQFTSPILTTDELEIQISPDGLQWLPMIGFVDVSLDDYGIPSLRTQEVASLTDSSGVALQVIDATTVAVTFGRYANKFTGYSSPWTTFTGGYKWRVRKAAAGVALGFSQASPIARGLAPIGVFAEAEDSVVDLQPRLANPADPDSSSDVKTYVKGSLYILMYNDAGTVRFKYLDMAGTGVTWVHTTTPP